MTSREMPWIPAVLVAALTALVALHLFEPKLAITWSYAHLGRFGWLPWLAAVIAGAAPFAVQRAWRQPWGEAPLTPWSARSLVALCLAVLVSTLVIAFSMQAAVLVADVKFLHDRMGDDAIVGRWHLLVTAYRPLVASLSGVASTEAVIRAANAFMGSIALVAIAGCARCLATNRREAIAIAAFSVTSLGVAQLVTGYADIYPVPLAIVATFCWLGLQSITGDRHPAWAFGLAALGPFVYLGTVLLAPALCVLAFVALREPGGWKQIVPSSLLAIAIVGVSTIPGFGAPFALRDFLAASFDVAVVDLGYTAGGYQLPFERIVGAEHLNDVAHTMLLVDPVGWLLVFIPGLFVFARKVRTSDRAKVAFLLSMLGGYAAFLLSMDSLYGAYLDWDLYSYGAIWTSLLGGYAITTYGRSSQTMQKWMGLLVGLALAAACIHLMARLHAMDIDHELHVQESEPHIFKRLIEER